MILAGLCCGPLSRFGVCWTSSTVLPPRESTTAEMHMEKERMCSGAEFWVRRR